MHCFSSTSEASGHRAYKCKTGTTHASRQSYAITGDAWRAVTGMMKYKYSGRCDCDYYCTATQNLVTFHIQRQSVYDSLWVVLQCMSKYCIVNHMHCTGWPLYRPYQIPPTFPRSLRYDSTDNNSPISIMTCCVSNGTFHSTQLTGLTAFPIQIHHV